MRDLILSAALFVAALLCSPNATQSYTWEIEVVDSIGDVGNWPSLALDANDYPHISYVDLTNCNLKYASHDGTEWRIEVVDSTSEADLYSSIALDALGHPHISYTTPGGGARAVRYVSWDGFSWQTVAIDSGRPFFYCSLALDSRDYPHIAYSFPLRYVRWDGESWQIDSIPDGELARAQISLALDSQDLPHIAYTHWIEGTSYYQIRYAKWDGQEWQIEVVDDSLDDWYPGHPSIALDRNDRPHVTYFYKWESETRYAVRNDSGWQIEVVDPYNVTMGTSLVLDSLDYPHISYGYAPFYAYWDGEAWQFETVDDYRGEYSSLALDSLYHPHIVCYDSYHDDLRYARGIVTGIEESTNETQPATYKLRQSYPNPFFTSTSISYYIGTPSFITLQVYDITGRLVKTLEEDNARKSGYHTIRWDAKDDSGNPVSNGVYFSVLRIEPAGFIVCRKMVLINEGELK